MLSIKVTRKVTALITFYIFLTLHSLNTSASEADPAVEKINQAIQDKLDFYNQTFPKIQFVHLKNGEWRKSLEALQLFIGYQATNLDYEHPENLREDLFVVTLGKIQMMLVNKITSSYLFKVGEMAAASKEYACVLTLDPATVLNNLVATQYLIELPEDTLKSLSPSAYIDNDRHLDFIIDHEIFHCIDTFQHGGIPMSDKAYSTRYDSFKRESQADMFAVAMHVHRNKTLTPCANNMMMMRGMTLINGEMQHNSTDAMQLIIDSDQRELINNQPKELFEIVKQLYKTIAPNYEKYLTYRVAAVEAIKRLGKQVNEMEQPFAPADRTPDEKMVQHLVKQTRVYYKQYTGKEYPLPTR